MPKGIYIRTKEARVNMGKAKMGNKNPMFGKPSWNKDIPMTEETRKRLNEAYAKNPPRYWLGKHRSEATNKKISKKNLGKIAWNKGLECPQFSGENNPKWKGGVTPLYDRIRRLLEYKEWRASVYERDNYTCQECGSQESGIFNAHHIKPFEDILQEFLQEYNQFSPYEDTHTLVRLAMKYEPFWDISIGITYCEKCHIKKHVELKYKKRG